MVTESAATVANEAGLKKAADHRRSNKPIMEKRRRARINNCLNQLKTLILDAMKKDPARHSKLEKADILEMTVKHLQSVRNAAAAAATAGSGVDAPATTMAGKFRAGFTECASEVGRFPGLEASVKRRLLQHLANCLNQQASIVAPTATPETSSVQPTTAPTNVILTPHGMQLVPTRLPNGDIALVLPQHNSPMMPSRTSSTSSAASSHYAASTSSSSSVSSPEPMDVIRYRNSPMQKPLALVMRKIDQDMDDVDDVAEVDDDDEEEEEDEKPWRPW